MFLESLTPLIAGGFWIPEMVALAGGRAELQQPGDAPLKLDWDRIRKARPEVLVISVDPSQLQPLLQQLTEFVLLPGWWTLPAVYSSEVYVVDAAYFTRVSPRVVDGVRMLARVLHPAKYDRALPEKSCWKLSMARGQRCRAKLLPNYFLPYGLS